MWLGLLALLPQSILTEVTNEPAQLSGVARARLASFADSIVYKLMKNRELAGQIAAE